MDSSCWAVVPWTFNSQLFFLRHLVGYEESCFHDESIDLALDFDDVDFYESDEEEDKKLMLLDPKNWREQDHYQVLGLAKARWKASEEHIRLAYRKKVLKHHPDKRRVRGLEVHDAERDYFTCITRAFEMLSDRTKRRSYDSADPEFDDSIPSRSEVTPSNFFEIFGPVFYRNAHFSRQRPVPGIGGPFTSRQEVERFYQFWYSFDSWREFSYLDEEPPEKAENRDERRYYDRCNRAQRQKRRNEELKRLRQLVDVAMSLDPRIARFKQNEQRVAEQKKKAKREAAAAKREEERRAREERLAAEKRAKEAEETRAREEQQRQKAEREQLKRSTREAKKALQAFLTSVDYFSEGNTERRLEHMDAIQSFVDSLALPELQALLQEVGGDREKGRKLILERANQHKASLRASHLEAYNNQTGSSAKRAAGGDAEGVTWSLEMTQHLVKAFNLFPAGTQQRWDTIATYINQRLPDMERPLNGKQVMRRAKNMQKNDAEVKTEVNSKAFDSFSKKVAGAESGAQSDITVRYDKENAEAWSVQEQKLLEQALRTYAAPAPDKWDKIAAAVGTKSKKECMVRFKELAALIKAKKEAAAAAAATSSKKTPV